MLNNSAEGIVDTVTRRLKWVPASLLLKLLDNEDPDHAQYVIGGRIKGHQLQAVRRTEQGPITAVITCDYPMLNPQDKTGKAPKDDYRKTAIAAWVMAHWNYYDIQNFEAMDYPLQLTFTVVVPDDSETADEEDAPRHLEHYDVVVMTPEEFMLAGVCVRCAQYWDKYTEELDEDSAGEPNAERWAREHLYHVAFLQGQVYKDGTLAPSDSYAHGFPEDTYQRLYNAGFTHIAYAPFDPVKQKSARLRDLVIRPISEVI